MLEYPYKVKDVLDDERPDELIHNHLCDGCNGMITERCNDPDCDKNEPELCYECENLSEDVEEEETEEVETEEDKLENES